MPLFEITNAQLSFRYSLGAPMPFHAKGCWISVEQHKMEKFNVIKAVATFEPKTLAAEGNSNNKLELRRMRISKANKGNTPWNKGRKHTPETLQKIREKTRLAMQNPKVKMKLINLGHAQTTETRMKIGAGVKMRWEKRRGKKMAQDTCCFEWQDLIAEASRQGYVGQEELQWNSYEIFNDQLKQEWLASVEQRKLKARTPGCRRRPKSPEQRRKIAEAITAKWADPEYRGRVCSALAKYHGTEAVVERKPRRKPSDGAQPTRKKPIAKRDTNTSIHVKSGSKVHNPAVLKKIKSPAYKDPLVNSKLEMIKNIRAQRAAAETKQTEAVERARLLIAEAEKAAKALEVAATKSPIAQSSLIETRKLIAEAIQSLESIDTQGITYSNGPSVGLSEVNKEEGSAFEVLNQSQMVAQVNGRTELASSDYKFSEDFGKFSLEKPVNGDPKLHLTNGCASLTFSLSSQIKESSPSSQQRETEQGQSNEYKTDPSPTVMGIPSLEDEMVSRSPIVTKKWVCGRLVEVAEEKK
ncbi:uncharacterized protein LOC113860854 isoform X2 [Abrus precatorius]|uniref:Uncharacterized protein LOC113860854 isoform X2 n=1 Tax=Abrus precatorius TaxID=3816 RepID=A0A8B8KYX0_ABRPR|nr:uncharacterized protein LOC113860854 isoform X2 [Abrus precatorius]